MSDLPRLPFGLTDMADSLSDSLPSIDVFSSGGREGDIAVYDKRIYNHVLSVHCAHREKQKTATNLMTLMGDESELQGRSSHHIYRQVKYQLLGRYESLPTHSSMDYPLGEIRVDIAPQELGIRE